MEKKLSPKKMEANRRNAQRSTGPRTPAGRRKVRWNAVIHGLLSGHVVLPLGEVQERPEEFAALVAHLRRDLTIRQLTRLQMQPERAMVALGGPPEIAEQSHSSCLESVALYRKASNFGFVLSHFDAFSAHRDTARQAEGGKQ